MAVSRTLLLVAGLAVLLLPSCGTTVPGSREYSVSGQVVAVRPERREVVIRHGDIKGFMPAMTMPFRVKDETVLAQAMPGAIVEATLVVQEGDAWLSRITDTGRREPLPREAVNAPRAMDPPLEPGSAVPDAALLDQDGRPLSIASLRGRPFALTFVYTRCPLPTFCPALDRQFERVQKAIKADPTLRGARLVSVSIDPEYDRPPVLKAHAARLGADPSVWTFATADANTIDAFGERFGLSVSRGQTPADLLHSLRTIVVDDRGRLVRTWDGTEWDASEVANALRTAGR